MEYFSVWYFLLFSSDVVNFVRKTNEGGGRGGGGQKALFCWFLFFGVALIVGGYLGQSKIASFSSRNLSRNNKHDSFWLVVSTGYFYVLFLWDIVVSDFLLLEIYKHLVLPLSSITFTINCQSDSLSINMLICIKYYTVWTQFFIKIHGKVFHIEV